jgi:hypothetical protein
VGDVRSVSQGQRAERDRNSIIYVQSKTGGMGGIQISDRFGFPNTQGQLNTEEQWKRRAYSAQPHSEEFTCTYQIENAVAQVNDVHTNGHKV